MRSAGAAGSRRSAGKTVVVVILLIIAVLAIIAGIMYLAEPAKSLPSVLGTITSPPARANNPRPLRGAGSFIIAVVALILAWFLGRSRPASRHR